jgi:hypothetical protein
MMIEQLQSTGSASPTGLALHHSGEEMSMDKIEYTFPAEFPIRELAGQTVRGGVISEIEQRGCTIPTVEFATTISGRRVIAKIEGKPELEAIYQDHLAAIRRKQETLAAIQWPAYQATQRTAINAAEAYERASEQGYPVREAAAALKADEALQEARANYPLAAAYALAESYSHAANDSKASAGQRAMQRIEQGQDPLAVAAEMQSEWSAAASKAVENA